MTRHVVSATAAAKCQKEEEEVRDDIDHRDQWPYAVGITFHSVNSPVIFPLSSSCTSSPGLSVSFLSFRDGHQVDIDIPMITLDSVIGMHLICDAASQATKSRICVQSPSSDSDVQIREPPHPFGLGRRKLRFFLEKFQKRRRAI